MRKAQKAQLLEIIQTLWEAHETIKKYSFRGSLEMAVTLLGECQRIALQVGEVIEESEGGDCPVIQLLEDYCEELYQASTSGAAIHKLNKRLNKALLRVENSIDADIAVQWEIVFLPYKASMWDSFESVWRAAEADPHCDAYVVPIPYYERNPDGSLGEFHYEGGLYPDDVPVVRYDLYDFEKRRPDAVFIHNGYDSYNYITSVHPDFYSTRLKRFSKLLLYIPYFIAVDSVSDGMCTVPGCWNADRTFLQSEKICREYIAAFQKLGMAEAEVARMAARLIALGSPKFDKAISARADEFDLPDQWSRLIKRPDGDRKKIVLYNTTITAMLQGNKQYLEKLRLVLEVFREREDVVLWWRPHPLSESTLSSMRPHLLEEYLQIVRSYQQGGWGIYDSTAGVNRAVAYADYYYGDAGSALQASFHAAGKPIMLQKIDSNKLIAAPLILGADGSRLFFAPMRTTSVLSLDLATHEFSVIKSGHSTAGWPYNQGVSLDGVMYFTPVGAQAIMAFDSASGQLKTIPYENERDRLLRRNPKYLYGSNFSVAYTYGNEVFFVGGTYPAIMCLDTNSGLLTYHSDWPSTFHNGDSHTIANCSCQMDSRIVLAGAAPELLYFDMKTKVFTVERVPHVNAANGFRTAAYGDGYLWLVLKETGSILKFNPSTKEVAEYSKFPAGRNCSDDPGLLSVYAKGYFWLFYYSTNDVLRLCADSGEISTVRIFPLERDEFHCSAYLAGNKIYAARFFSREITCYDAETGTYCDLIPPIEILRKANIPDSHPKDIHETVLRENGIDTIETLLGAQVEDRERLLAEWIASPDGRAGERIYQYVKEMLVSGET